MLFLTNAGGIAQLVLRPCLGSWAGLIWQSGGERLVREGERRGWWWPTRLNMVLWPSLATALLLVLIGSCDMTKIKKLDLLGRVITLPKIHFLDKRCLTGMPTKLSMPHHWRHLNTAWERLSAALPLPLAFMYPRALCKCTLLDFSNRHRCFTSPAYFVWSFSGWGYGGWRRMGDGMGPG